MYDYSTLPHRSMLMIDSRSFYASAHCSLLGLDPFTTYLAVVGDPDRSGSIVLAASIALKRDFGVSNVSRYFELPKDPGIIVVKAQMGKYIETSLEVTKILNQFAPFDSILQYSVDEAWCDITGTEKLFGDKWKVARMIRDKIWKEVKIPVTIGIGPNMLVSKLCLDMAAKKAPEGIAEWTYEELPLKMFHMPIKEMWGIGSRMERNLNRMGIRTIGHLARFDKAILEKKWGVMGTQLHQHCWGIDTSQVQPNYDVTHKSYGNGITLLRDYDNPLEIKIVIRELCDEVTRRARKDKMVGRTISLGIGYSKDVYKNGFSHSVSIHSPTNFDDEVFQACLKIFNQHYHLGAAVRNVYVSLSHLTPDDQVQLDLFSFKTREKKRKLSAAIDDIRDRFGTNAILRASSYLDGGIAISRSMKIGGHNA